MVMVLAVVLLMCGCPVGGADSLVDDGDDDWAHSADELGSRQTGPKAHSNPSLVIRVLLLLWLSLLSSLLLLLSL